MAVPDNKQLVRRWFEEVWNQRRAEAIDALFAPDGVVYLGGEATGGHAEFRAFHTEFLTLIPDLQFTVEDILAEGDKTAARCTARGTSATGRPLFFEGIALVRWREGQIVEAWNAFDIRGVLEEAAQLPEPWAKITGASLPVSH